MNDHLSLDDTRIARPNVYQLVADRLMAEIVDQGLAEGDPVPTEKDLSDRFGVGRSSVREGLRMLESHGVIRLSGRGTYVVGSRQAAMARALTVLLGLGAVTLIELHDLRRPIEMEVAAKAAIMRDDDDLAALREAIERMRRASDDRGVALEADLAFHLAMARATHNGALIAAVTGVREVLRGLIRERVVDMDEAIRQHEAILARIEARDAEGARAAVAGHMTWILETLDGGARA
jgi:GntR family transcriptional repressor for pyruvate dehydrogenase complex